MKLLDTIKDYVVECRTQEEYDEVRELYIKAGAVIWPWHKGFKKPEEDIHECPQYGLGEHGFMKHIVKSSGEKVITIAHLRDIVEMLLKIKQKVDELDTNGKTQAAVDDLDRARDLSKALEERPGKLIVLEGEDGTGKTTQAGLLEELLIAKGFKVKRVKYPDYDKPTGALVTRYLKNEFGNASTLDPILSCSLYSLDRLAGKADLEKALKDNDYVIMDRYFYSNIALQGSKVNTSYKEIKDFVIDTEFARGGLPIPDLTIWLNNNSNRSVKERLSARSAAESGTGEALDGHESNAGYMERVKKTYEVMAKDLDMKEVKLIDNNGVIKTPVCIANEIELLISDL